jgi:hypothetical protein
MGLFTKNSLTHIPFRCHQPHCGCCHCSLVSPVGCVWKFPLFDMLMSGLWYGPRIDIGRLVFNPLQVIATRIFIVLFLRLEVKRSVMWLVMISQWSLIGAIGFAGPATARTDKHGPFCEYSYRRSSRFLKRSDDHLQMALRIIGVGYLRTILPIALCAYFIFSTLLNSSDSPSPSQPRLHGREFLDNSFRLVRAE